MGIDLKVMMSLFQQMARVEKKSMTEKIMMETLRIF